MTANAVDELTGRADNNRARQALNAASAAQERQIALSQEQIDYARERDNLNRQLAQESDQRAYEFAQRQFEAAQALDERNFERANQLDAYRRGLADDMMSDADMRLYGADELDRRLGNANSDVTRAFSKAREMTARRMGQYGVNPASGAYSGAMERSAREQSIAEVGAANKAREGMRADRRFEKMESRTGRQRARLAGLGLTDTSLGLNNYQQSRSMPRDNMAQLGLGSMEYGARQGLANVYGGQYSNQMGLSVGYTNAARASRNALVQAGFQLAGIAVSGGAGSPQAAAAGGGGGGFTNYDALNW